jgi:hypothetical protein
MELTNQERKLIERSAIKYQSTFYRRSQLLGWIGVALFGIGLMRSVSLSASLLPAWCSSLFLWAGFTIIFWSQYALAVTVIGKLYAQVQGLERQPEKR